jgi:hypothetical protein
VVLFANQDVIKERTIEILKKAGSIGHVMNLGHGIEAATPEENAHFFQTVLDTLVSILEHRNTAIVHQHDSDGLSVHFAQLFGGCSSENAKQRN